MYHNRYAKSLYCDSDAQSNFVGRVKAFEEYNTNPLRGMLTHRGFRNVVVGHRNIADYFGELHILNSLNLDLEDVVKYVGRPFQNKCSSIYILKFDKTLTMSQSTTNQYMYKFTNISSKFKSGKNRSCIIDFKDCLAALDENAMIHEPFTWKAEAYAAHQSLPKKLRFLHMVCSCKTGLRMLLPCGHVAAILTFIWHAMNITIDKLFEDSKKRKAIKSKILDCEIGKRWIKNNTDPRYCICNQPKVQGKLLIPCEVCRKLFHPECVGSTSEEWRLGPRKVKKGFICSQCNAIYFGQ